MSPADFYSAFHQDLWEALRRLGGTPDWITLAADLRAKYKGRYDETLEAKLQEIGYAVPSAFGYEGYAAIVKDCAERRRIINGCREVALAAYDSPGSCETLSAKLLGVAGGADGRPSGKLLSEYVDLAQRQSLGGGIVGVSTGLPCLDAALGGLAPGRLVIVGARPGQGKSSLIAQAAVCASEKGAGTLFFSLEMSGTELAARMICSKAGVDSAAYMQGRLTPGDRAKTDAAAKQLNGSFYIDETPNLSIDELRLRAIRHRAKFDDLGLLVVDYLGLASAPHRRGEGRHLEVGAVSRGLKELAKELHVPVLAAHQLNRNADDKVDAAPKLSQLRESGSCEQDADQVVLLWPFQKDPRTGMLVDWQAQVRPVAVFVAKNRHGAQAVLYVNFRRTCTRFEEESASFTDTTKFDPYKSFGFKQQERLPGDD